MNWERKYPIAYSYVFFLFYMLDQLQVDIQICNALYNV
jgi:hypothetical protein